jgi:hypothetical protein
MLPRLLCLTRRDVHTRAEQTQVPEGLPALVKAYTKEAIRYAPRDLVAFSRDYFAALADGSKLLTTTLRWSCCHVARQAYE